MRAAACAAVIGATALAAGCHSSNPPGFAHPHVVRGTVVGPDPVRVLEERMGVSVDFVTLDHGFLATGSGRILATKNGGQTWTPTHSPVPGANGIDFVSATHGFALTVRFVLLETDDGGASWHRVHRFPEGSATRADALSRGVVFTDATDGWVTTTRGLFRTRDGGRTWAALDYPCDEYDHPVGPAFTDAANGYVVCGGQPATDMQEKSLYVTSDGGETWKLRAGSTIYSLSRRNPLPAIGGAKGLVFRTQGSGVLTSSRGGIDRTDDGGYSWRRILDTDDVDDPIDVSWPGKDRIYALTFHAGLLRSDDGGGHWRIVYEHGLAGPSGPIAFFSPRNGLAFGAEDLAGGQRAVFVTRDAGTTWRRAGTLPMRFGAQQAFRFGRTVLAASSDTLTRSDDGGRHWARVFSMPRRHFGSFSFVSPEVGYYVDSAHRLFRTEDGGSTWKLAHAHTGELQGVIYTTDREAYVVEHETAPDTGTKTKLHGTEELVRSTDGGVSWRAVRAPMMGGILGMYRLDDRHWWFLANADCTRRGACAEQVWRTDDAGNHWELIRLPKEITSGIVSFVSPSVGFAGSPAAGLYRTADGGVTWRLVYPR